MGKKALSLFPAALVFIFVWLGAFAKVPLVVHNAVVVLISRLNPGNIINGPFAQSFGAIPPKKHQRFAIFPSPELGEMAMASLLFDSIGYRDLTLRQAINKYAPPVENKTSRYVSHVLLAVGGVNKPMKEYSAAERQLILNAMEIEEGR